jgi:hypothetical protein
MIDPRVTLKNPALAAVLAFLLPGLGHAYQGRFFKATVYAVCILGTFFAGMALGDWQPVYIRRDANQTRYSYLAQVWVGVPAFPAVVQKMRYERDQERGVLPGLDSESALDTEFDGTFVTNSGMAVELTGSVSLRQAEDTVTGTFKGTNDAGEVVTLPLDGVNLHPKVYPSRERLCECQVVDDDGVRRGRITGVIPRAFIDWCQVPLGGPNGDGTYDNSSLAAVHGRLGKRFDLASVFTWVAGLLNILAIWDAFEGPAYGFGDEESSDEDSSSEDDAEGDN